LGCGKQILDISVANLSHDSCELVDLARTQAEGELPG